MDEKLRDTRRALRRMLHWFGKYPEWIPSQLYADAVAADIANAKAVLPPQIEDLQGIDITGGVAPEDYIRQMRDEDDNT